MENVSNIRVWVGNVDDVIDFEKKLHSLGYAWSGNRKYLIRDGDIGLEPKTFIFSLENQQFDTFGGYNIRPYGNETDIKVLNYPEEESKIMFFLRRGGLSPSYKPKKVLRENNNILNESWENGISNKRVYVKTDDILDFEHLLHSLSYRWTGESLDNYSIRDGALEKVPKTFFFNFDTKRFDAYDGLHKNQYHREGQIEIFYYPQEKMKIINLLRTGNLTPSYDPKKILRESVEDILFDLPPKTLSVEEQEKQFKLGDEVYIRPDAYKYFTDIDERNMNKLLGKKGEIVGITNIYEQYGSNIDDLDFAFPDDIIGSVSPNDLLVYVHIKDDQYWYSKDYYWYYKCLINEKYSTPTYKPRKILKESSEFNYPYKEIVVYIENQNELILFNEFLKDVNAIYDESRILNHILLPNYYFIDVKKFHNERKPYVVRLSDNRITSDMVDAWVYGDPFVNSNIFTVKDFKVVESILLHGKEEFKPTYKPRKITRLDEDYFNKNEKIMELEQKILRESVNDYKYKEIVLKINNYEESQYAKKYLIDAGINFNSSVFDDISPLPNYLFIDVRRYHIHDNTFIILLTDDIVTEELIKEFVYDDNNVNNYIFSINELNRVKKILLEGTDIIKPSYEPRKINKLYEDFRDKQSELSVWVENLEDTLIFEDKLHKLGYTWPDKLLYEIRDGLISNSKKMFIFNTEEKLFDTYNYYYKNDDSFVLEYPKDEREILRYLRFNRKSPTYKPKKISRLDESSSHYYYRFKTEEELEEEFGEDWEFLIDNKYMWNSEYMDYLLGTKLDITDEDILKAKTTRYGTKYIIIPNNPDLSGLNIQEQDEWYIAVDLLKKVKLKPTYSPKKIER